MRRFVHFLSLVMIGCIVDVSQAHFFWIVVDRSGAEPVAKVYFGEVAEPESADLLEPIGELLLEYPAERGDQWRSATAKLDHDEAALIASLPAGYGAAPMVLHHDYGVITRGDQPFLLRYYAKAYPFPLPGTWKSVSDPQRLPLEITPALEGTSIRLQVRWQGKPAVGAEVTIDGPQLSDSVKGNTDQQGVYTIQLPASGTYSIRARVIEEQAGEHNGQAYSQVRHYSTLTLPYAPPRLQPAAHSWPELPRGITSFGGAIVGDALYVYGGHYGRAHHYSRDGQSEELLRLDLAHSKAWERVATGPRLTGTSLVAWNDGLIRVGGFSALNIDDEEEQLVSRHEVARFDLQSHTWQPLPPLPEGRSSHDAAVLGGKLYVVGGWEMVPGEETRWHNTAWQLDLENVDAGWQPLPAPPFQRRALAVAAFDGRLYVIGGMRPEGGPTTEVAVFDPRTEAWSAAANILGGAMDGFGCSAFAVGNTLYVTTMSGSIQALSNPEEGAQQWQYVGQLEHPRFFHRLLPWREKDLVVVGGAHMDVGKITQLERIPVEPSLDR
ncbi:MAG: DUF4198 domain-containing protein [Planctomycetota bacterium]|nr:MAG: DUF4198 domain-containing protein [Planctomycetota bacterium]